MGVPLEVADPGKVEARVAEFPVHSVILDLNHSSGRSVELARAIKANPATRNVRVLGFLSHVQSELAVAARAAGCDVVLARSAFVQQLPQLLLSLTG